MADAFLTRRYFVSGVVQGVGYRYFAQRAAMRLGLTGYTRNLRDGRVEVYAAGSQGALAALRRELERGPQGASVSQVAVEEADANALYTGAFSIEYDA